MSARDQALDGQPVQQAYRNFEMFRDIKASAEWAVMERFMRHEMQKLTREVMESDFTDDERRAKIAAYRAIKSFADMPHQQFETLSAYFDSLKKPNDDETVP